ncbi:thiamine-phosphate kinase [Phycisphaerales bacterium AB-hyl4]|uniref:Thiamine-monophosphate kinase n=1 Tax=Natronomicrosphaera hydrolytica TaxID=3242702 RepID=A0ABV4U468_9BACT
MREFDLLAHVYRSNVDLPADVAIPPGDDMGAIRLGGQTLLVTVDQLADGVHVDLATASLEQVARKAVTRNLSDVAAMAARPVGAVVAVSLPRDFGDTRATELFDSMRRTAAAFDCPLVGGDIAMWDHPLLISVTVFAEPGEVEPVLRSGAQPGDGIYVTGRLGGSNETLPDHYTHHLDFMPRITLARELAGDAATRPSSMIDLSDGLARDLKHLCDAGNLDADLTIADLPLSDGAHQAARRTNEPAWQHALGDGEDYELLFTAPRSPRIETADVPITRIGTMRPCAGATPAILLHLPDGATCKLADLPSLGWEHHA